MNPIVVLEQCTVDDCVPLFYSPGKAGFYTPREGLASPERLNAFRNVGRLVEQNTENQMKNIFNNFRFNLFQLDRLMFTSKRVASTVSTTSCAQIYSRSSDSFP